MFNILESVPAVELINEFAKFSVRATLVSAGYDIHSVVDTIIPARSQALIPRGLKIKAPKGTYCRIAPRSGLAFKNMIGVGAGAVDRDYTGEVGAIAFNHAEKASYHVKTVSRVAQMICEKINTVPIVQGKIEESTSRGFAGFGSTGTGDTVRMLDTTSRAAKAPTHPSPQFLLKVIRFKNLFSGPSHDEDLSWWFRQLGPKRGYTVLTSDFDILLAPLFDLLKDDFYCKILEDIDQG